MKNNTILRPGDIIFTQDKALLGKLIRFCTRSIGESKTEVNHTAIAVRKGTLDKANIIEALWEVKKHTIVANYGMPTKVKVAIYRPINLLKKDIKKIVDYAEKQVGKKYGVGKIITSFLDWICQGKYVFRRLTSSEEYPICSFLVAHCYSQAGKDFGVNPNAATPDDIWDFVNKNIDKYTKILDLQTIE